MPEQIMRAYPLALFLALPLSDQAALAKTTTRVGPTVSHTHCAGTVALLTGRWVGIELRGTGEKPPAPGIEIVARVVDASTECMETVLWRGPMPPMEYPSDQLTWAQTKDGRWMLGATYQTGTGTGLELWSGLAMAVTGDTVQASTPTHTVVTSVALDNLQSQAAGGGAKVIGLLSCQLFAWGANVFAVGSGTDNARAIQDGGGQVWIAKLPEAGAGVFSPTGGVTQIEGHSIAEGVDPRIVVSDNEAVLAIRAPFSRADADGPVRFYRSKDLQQWAPDMDMWQFVHARNNYSITSGVGIVWLITTTGDVPPTATESARPAVGLWSFDAARKRWSECTALDPKQYEVRSAADRLWLISFDASLAQAGVLFFTDTKGVLQRRRP